MGPRPLGKTQLSHYDFVAGIGTVRGTARRTAPHRSVANPKYGHRQISVMDKGGTDYLGSANATREYNGRKSPGRRSK